MDYVDKVSPWPHRQFSEVHKISTNYKISTPINIPNRLGIHNNALYQQKTAKCECWLLFLMESMFNCRAWKVQISYSVQYLLRVAFPLCVSLLGMLFTKISPGINVLWLVYVYWQWKISILAGPTDQLVPYTAYLLYIYKKLKSTHQARSRFKLTWLWK